MLDEIDRRLSHEIMASRSFFLENLLLQSFES
jgi:hypothetical protein